MRRFLWGALLAALVSTGCPDTNVPLEDAGPADASTAASRPTFEPSTTGGRVSGGAYTVDVQLGHPFTQGPVTGGGTTTEGGALIKF